MEIFPLDMYRHIHTAAVSTWSHVLRVEKNAYPTPKQASKTLQIWNGACLSCCLVAELKRFLPHKETSAEPESYFTTEIDLHYYRRNDCREIFRVCVSLEVCFSTGKHRVQEKMEEMESLLQFWLWFKECWAMTEALKLLMFSCV